MRLRPSSYWSIPLANGRENFRMLEQLPLLHAAFSKVLEEREAYQEAEKGKKQIVLPKELLSACGWESNYLKPGRLKKPNYKCFIMNFYLFLNRLFSWCRIWKIQGQWQFLFQFYPQDKTVFLPQRQPLLTDSCILPEMFNTVHICNCIYRNRAGYTLFYSLFSS